MLAAHPVTKRSGSVFRVRPHALEALLLGMPGPEEAREELVTVTGLDPDAGVLDVQLHTRSPSTGEGDSHPAAAVRRT